MRYTNGMQRFFNKTIKLGDCLIWSSTIGQDGYGKFWLDGANQRAHRVVWQLKNGPIPEGLQVCHKCDNPLCVNIEHLFLGTPKQNMQDKVSKGRAVGPDSINHSHIMKEKAVRGEKHWNSKVPDSSVQIAQWLTSIGMSRKDTSIVLGVRPSTVSRWVTGARRRC